LNLKAKLESSSSTIYFQALKQGAFNRVACGNITEYHTWVSSQRPKANDVLFRACKHGFQPAPPHLGVVAAVDEDVLALEVPVHDAAGRDAVEVGTRRRHLLGDPQRAVAAHVETESNSL
jgi:hypothetical protein